MNETLKYTYTPGPWKVYDKDFRIIIIDNGDVICDIRKWQDRGNADLIAAAPDLLVALQMIVAGDYGGGSFSGSQCVEIAGPAIAKALGK